MDINVLKININC